MRGPGRPRQNPFPHSRPARLCAEPGGFYPQVRIRARCTQNSGLWRGPPRGPASTGRRGQLNCPGDAEKGGPGLWGHRQGRVCRSRAVAAASSSRKPSRTAQPGPAEQTRGGRVMPEPPGRREGRSLARCGRRRNSLCPLPGGRRDAVP